MDSWGMVGWSSMVDRGRGVVSTIRPGSSNSEEGSSNESLKGRNIEMSRIKNVLEMIQSSLTNKDYL